MFRYGISRHVPRMLNTSFVGRFSPQMPTFSTQAERPAQRWNGGKNNASTRSMTVGAFIKAVRSSDMNAVKTSLTNGLPVDYAASALHEVRTVGMLHILLDAKADINSVTSDGLTPLMMALRHKSTRVADAMIAAKADVNYATADGHCPLDCAVVNCPDFVDTLLKAGAVIPTYPIGSHAKPFLHLAVSRNLHSIVETMLPSADLTAVDAMGNNFVAVAAHSANADEKMMSLVLKHATVEQINAVNKENCSVFERAAFHNSPAVVRLLLDAKAEVNRAGGQPLLPMTVTKRGTIPEGMLQTLVEAGADIDAEGNNENTALHLAAFRGLKGVVETLISLKADVNSVNVHELTPLVAALSKGLTDVAEVLLAAGGTAPGERSEQQLIEAASRGNEVAVDILLRAKVDIDAENDRGFTPLKSALNFGHLHIVEKLIAAGADTVMDRDSLIGVCRKRKINPAVIGLADDSGKWIPHER